MGSLFNLFSKRAPKIEDFGVGLSLSNFDRLIANLRSVYFQGYLLRYALIEVKDEKLSFSYTNGFALTKSPLLIFAESSNQFQKFALMGMQE